MRTSRFLLATVKEVPADAEIVSHRLMIRAGMIRKLAAGIYSWLPLGWRVLHRVEEIVRQEMNRAGAQELLMPGVQPAELWHESGRWLDFGPELLRIQDRHQRDFCLGPTHEEVITSIVRAEIRSYRQLPINLYQSQWKFRDEVRPRFGVMRAREFLMKDAYSFDLDQAGLDRSYEIMFDAYRRIFDRFGLEYCAVEADSGAMGGNRSHEFQVLAESGEDVIAICERLDYAANIDLAPALPPVGRRPRPSKTMQAVDTPQAHTIETLCEFLGAAPETTLKTLLVRGAGGLIALAVRGDHELNVTKAEKLPQVAKPLEFADAEEIRAVLGCGPGSVGPVGIEIPVIADESAARLSDFVCGANREDTHLRGVNWGRDLPEPEVADLRKVVDGDPCPHPDATDGDRITLRRGIEVGHVFQLGTKYSESMGATCLDEHGRAVPLVMGCYGIGVSRVVAAAIEQNHDENGIIWPEAIAPFDVCIVPIGMHKATAVREATDVIYEELRNEGMEVLLDDRDERPGVMFADMDLIGIPQRIVVSERGLQHGIVEHRLRRDGTITELSRDGVTQAVTARARRRRA